MEVDLHTHSIYSDGQYTPTELLEKAKHLGLKYFAITDHDSIEGSKKLIAENRDDITIYSGVELNANVECGQMHILGYNFDLENQELNEKLDFLKQCSIENMKEYIRQLKEKHNIELPSSDIVDLFKGNNLHRPILALLLVKNGYCKDVPDAFEKYLKDSRTTKKINGLAPEECIRLIKSAGGVAILAHPWTTKLSHQALKEKIKYLKTKGLDGLEIYHSGTTKNDTLFYKDLANKMNLITTGGSDFHGEKIKPDILLARGRNNLNINKDDINITTNITSRY